MIIAATKMNSILMKCTTSLKPCSSYIVGFKRLLATTPCQLNNAGPSSSNSGEKLPPRQSGGKSSKSSESLVSLESEGHQSQYENDVKTKILNASLQFVPVHGWTKTAISAGAETLGYPGVIHGMFPKGGFDLVQHFYTTSNKRLADILIIEYRDSSPEVKGVDGSSRTKIEKAVRTRLEMIIPYIKEWPQALAIQSLPPNVPTSLANLLCLVDDIFYYSGDKSVDMSWYTRRVVLAGIYKSTELYMLQDQSVEYANSWEFLKRRMDEAAQVRSYVQASEQASQVAKDFATSAFITARSILGLSWNR